MTMALEWGEGSASLPGRSLPPGKTRYPLYRGLGGPEGRSGQVRKFSPPPGFDPRTVQPITSRYTDYATRPTIIRTYRHQIVELPLIFFPQSWSWEVVYISITNYWVINVPMCAILFVSLRIQTDINPYTIIHYY